MNFQTWLEQNGGFNGSTVQYPVYHGTNNRPFQQFQYQKSQRHVLFASFEVEAKGFFFAENPHDALAFGKNVAECYVNLRNPLLDPRRDKHLGVDRLPYKKELELMKVLAPMVQKDQHGHFMDIGVGRHYLKTRHNENGRDWIYYAFDGDGLDWDCLDNPQVIQRMKQLGYDGTFVAEPDSHIGRSIFVPSAEQIRIVRWLNRPQPSWGQPDDYGTKKKDGLNHFYGPGI